MPNLSGAILTDHAIEQIADRGISQAQIREVLAHPEQIMPVRRNRIVAQRLFHLGEPARAYLIRVFIDEDRQPPEVVTAYRTSKIDKYRSRP